MLEALTLPMTAFPLPFAQAAAPTPKGIFEHLTAGGPVVLSTLGLLVLLSLISWLIIGIKWVQIRRAAHHTDRFMGAFDRASNFADAAVAAEAFSASPLAAMYHAARAEIEGQRAADPAGATLVPSVQRALLRSAREGIAALEGRLGFLATVASAAPFIGLFGTVWGIMDAFAFIRPDEPILTTVTPHIAQALIATAVGLATAIPAVMAYNYFVGRVRAVSVALDGFVDELLNRLYRAYPGTTRQEPVPFIAEGGRG